MSIHNWGFPHKQLIKISLKQLIKYFRLSISRASYLVWVLSWYDLHPTTCTCLCQNFIWQLSAALPEEAYFVISSCSNSNLYSNVYIKTEHMPRCFYANETNTNTKINLAHLLFNSSTSIFNAIFNQLEKVSKSGSLLKKNTSLWTGETLYHFISILLWQDKHRSAHYFTSCIKDANPPRRRRMFDVIWSNIYCLWLINSFSVIVKK